MYIIIYFKFTKIKKFSFFLVLKSMLIYFKYTTIKFIYNYYVLNAVSSVLLQRRSTHV
jgi:hypothetical protein